MFILDLYTILPLTCAMFVFLFGVFVLSKGVRSRMNQLMFGFCMSMFFWMFGSFMMFGTRGTSVETSVFWDRFVYIGVVFMPSFMHHFSLFYTGSKKQKYLLFVNYALSFVFLFLSRLPSFIDGLYIYTWGAHSKAHILHTVFMGYFFLGTGIFFINILKYYRNLKDKISRVQTIYVFLAFAIVIFIGGSAYLLAYGIDTRFPFAYITGLIFPIMLFYAVTRHHLLGAKVIGTEVLIGLANFVLVTEIYLSKTTTELFIRILFAVILAFISYLLVSTARKEIKRREEVTNLAHSLEKANLKLQELDRQKTEFLSIASHQLRTPLSILKGYIELLTDGAYGKPTAKMVKTLKEMDESNERLVKLVDEFLDITRIEQGRTKFVFHDSDLHEMVASVVKELGGRAADKGLVINWRPSQTHMPVNMDDEKVRHVVFNFIDNAIKYSDKGVITVETAQEDKGVSVRVTDSGLGFGKEDEANFFQKFYRGKNVQGTNVNGTGLGLFVCKKFIETHGGRVWATSEGLGKGSEFGLWIPTTRKAEAVKEVEETVTVAA